MIGIIDYGMGNIHSVQKALESFGEKTVIVNRPAQITGCAKLVLPGVGAFDDAMLALKEQDLISALKDYLAKKKIFLGICLGMQLLFEESEEAKEAKGLGVFKGRVVKFPHQKNLKVPQIGWNQLKKAVSRKSSVVSECPLLKNIDDGEYVYFCHSYYPQPDNSAVVVASTEYGINFASVVGEENIYGVQFHPEKSQETGLKILKNFIELC